MKLTLQTILGLALLAAVPATAAIFHAGDWPGARSPRNENDRAAMSVWPKDAARVSNDRVVEADDAGSPVELAQASHDFAWPPARIGAFGGPVPPFPPPPFPPAPLAGGAFAPFGPPAMRPPFTRSDCEEGVNRRAALAGYLKSKLRLDSKQKEAWQRLEQAAEPAVEKIRDNCQRLPVEMDAPPSPPDAIDMVQRQLADEAELLQALREPLRALYETLSSEQRRALAPPLPPRPRL